jgi:outer membrane beta-barrel protein
MRFYSLAPLGALVFVLGMGISPAYAAPAPAAQQEHTDVAGPRVFDRVHAVPRKRMLKRLRVELSGHLAGSLNDAYYHHLSAGGEITFYPMESLGIGISGEYFFEHADRSAVEWVRRGFLSTTADYATPTWGTWLTLYWLPVDGKFSLFDSMIGYFDIYAGLGGGVVATSIDALRPAITASLGQHFVVADFLTVRFELRDFLYFDEHQFLSQTRSSIRNQLMFRIGFGLFIPPSFEYRSL